MQSVTTYVVFCDSIFVLAEYQAQLTEKKNYMKLQLCFYVLVFFPWLNLRLKTQFSLAKTVAIVLSNAVFIAFFSLS